MTQDSSLRRDSAIQATNLIAQVAEKNLLGQSLEVSNSDYIDDGEVQIDKSLNDTNDCTKAVILLDQMGLCKYPVTATNFNCFVLFRRSHGSRCRPDAL